MRSRSTSSSTPSRGPWTFLTSYSLRLTAEPAALATVDRLSYSNGLWHLLQSPAPSRSRHVLAIRTMIAADRTADREVHRGPEGREGPLNVLAATPAAVDR